MPNPKHRHCKSRTAKRRANWKLSAPNISLCPKCQEPILSHRTCPSCGNYRDRKIIEVVEKEVI